MKFKFERKILEIVIEKYERGGQAIIACCKNGDIFTVLSVCLDTPPQKNCFWLKNYSENEDIAKFMLAEGLVRLTGRTMESGFVTIPEAKLIWPDLGEK